MEHVMGHMKIRDFLGYIMEIHNGHEHSVYIHNNNVFQSVGKGKLSCIPINNSNHFSWENGNLIGITKVVT